MNRLVILAATLVLAACTGPTSDVPSIQHSAEGQPRTDVSINRVMAGRYRTIAPTCVGQRYRITLPATGVAGAVERASGLPIHPGHVVEFRNFMPEVPSNVTALEAPKPMYSPNLMRPYNMGETEGDEYSAWRYEFEEPGIYEWFDTNMGTPGRAIVDSYYGTVSYVGESDAPRGVVCVDAPSCRTDLACLGADKPADCCSCISVCCDVEQHCGSGLTCHRGRCIDPASLEEA